MVLCLHRSLQRWNWSCWVFRGEHLLQLWFLIQMAHAASHTASFHHDFLSCISGGTSDPSVFSQPTLPLSWKPGKLPDAPLHSSGSTGNPQDGVRHSLPRPPLWAFATAKLYFGREILCKACISSKALFGERSIQTLLAYLVYNNITCICSNRHSQGRVDRTLGPSSPVVNSMLSYHWKIYISL